MVRIKRMTAALVAAVLALAVPAVANADTLPGGLENQSFATGPGDWTSETDYDGLCIPALTCPVTTNGHVASGGAGGAGDGYIRTHFVTVLAAGLTGTASGVWSSPEFTYDGNGGRQPTSVTLDLKIRPALAGLVSALNDSRYRVDLVESGTGNVVSAVPSTALTNSNTWSAAPTASINPTLLTIGKKYRIRITTTYDIVASVAADGEVGYDDVRLTTSGVADDGGAGGGTGGSRNDDRSGGGKSGTTVPTPKKLKKIARKHVLPDRVELSGRAIRVRTECPPQAGAACRVQVRGLSRGTRSRTATRVKTAKLDPNRARTLQLRIKPRHLPAYRDARRVTLRSRVTVGGVKVIVAKKVRVLR